ncbi:thioesterase II family protein [Kordia sp.]|uniref:thioesterase II family protein n=1 Tax=Kordia sp. TaxID=1965332 RepID=UPI003D267272
MKAEKFQIILLHFAGGSAYSYDFLKKQLTISNAIEFHALELPGRGRRHSEACISSKEAAIHDYVQQIKNLRNSKPYLIYGHSMGATLGLSITKEMENSGDSPVILITSGNPGPGIKETAENQQKRYLMNDSDFKKELRKLGGVPEEVLTNQELYEFFGPIMRADFKVLENDDFSEKGLKINTPIHAIMGTEEWQNECIDNWKNFTKSGFQHSILSGNHFFIHQNAVQLSEIILKYTQSPALY